MSVLNGKPFVCTSFVSTSCPQAKVPRRNDQRVDHRGMVMARRGAKAGAARPESGATPPWLTEKERGIGREREETTGKPAARVQVYVRQPRGRSVGMQN